MGDVIAIASWLLIAAALRWGWRQQRQAEREWESMRRFEDMRGALDA